MHQSDNIDTLLEEWNKIKDCVIPTPTTAEEAIRFTNSKDMIASTVHSLQISKLQNDATAEQFWKQNFCNIYNQFTKEYTFRILKSGS